MPSVLSVQLVSENAKVPEYDNVNQYTFFASEDFFIPANKIVYVPAGLIIAYPKNYAGLFTSGFGLNLIGGLTDSDSRAIMGSICFSSTDRYIKIGDPIAKVIMIEIALPKIVLESELETNKVEKETEP